MLARREHSVRELKLKLAQRGYAKPDSESALTALTRDRYQSDERYAEVLIRHRAAAGYGPRYIEAELRSHGIAAAAHRALLDGQDWPANARDLVRKRYGAKPNDTATRTKAAQFLSRRGFSSEVIRRVMGAVDLAEG
jgi:regulatory protein